MKRVDLGRESLSREFSEVMELVGEQWQKNPLPIQIFLLLCLGEPGLNVLKLNLALDSSM
jgi:K+-transporting ATPase c subunit